MAWKKFPNNAGGLVESSEEAARNADALSKAIDEMKAAKNAGERAPKTIQVLKVEKNPTTPEQQKIAGLAEKILYCDDKEHKEKDGKLSQEELINLRDILKNNNDHLAFDERKGSIIGLSFDSTGIQILEQASEKIICNAPPAQRNNSDSPVFRK
jgi:hypothetical protein